MSIRKAFFWVHLGVGVLAGLVIFTMAATGILIAYEKQIVAAAEPKVSVANGAQLLGVEELAKEISAAFPSEKPTALTIRRDATEPVVVNLGRERVVLANPVTGEILGEGSKWRGFLHQVEQVHRNLAIGPNGKAITGAASIAFFILILSGLYLWFPKKWTKAYLKPALVPSLKLSGKARHWNWHNSIGFWAALALMLTTLTGMVISYKWANDLVFRMTGNEPPPTRTAAGPRGERGGERGERANSGEGRERGKGREGRGNGGESLRVDGLGKMWATAIEKIPAWQSITLRFRENPGAPLTFMVDEGSGTRPDLRSQIAFDAKTSEIQKFEPFASYNLGRQIRTWVKPLHTGEAFGVIGQTISALAALAALILVWTGFGLALRRFKQRSRGAVRSVLSTSPNQKAESLAGTTAPVSEAD